MKKLTLTFCALFALFAVAAALYADGPEKYSGKEKEVMQPAPPVCDFYRAHEWDLGIWGAYAFAADTGQFPVDRRRIEGSLVADPFSPDSDPFVQDYATGFIAEPQLFNPNERVNIGQVSKNQLFARDDTWGGGVDVKYFWSKYFGAGIEGIGLAAKTNFAGGGLVTLTGRYPFGRFAPYITGGIGFIDGGATLYEFFNEKHEFGALAGAPAVDALTVWTRPAWLDLCAQRCGRAHPLQLCLSSDDRSRRRRRHYGATSTSDNWSGYGRPALGQYAATNTRDRAETSPESSAAATACSGAAWYW